MLALIVVSGCAATQTVSGLPSSATSASGVPVVTLPRPSEAADVCQPADTVEITTIPATDSRIGFEPMNLALVEPTYLAGHPTDPGRLYVSERAGRVLLIDGGALVEDAVLDVSDDLSTTSENGLHSLAVHPDGTRLYAAYNDAAGDIRISEFVLDADGRQARDERLIFMLDKPEGITWHNGGQLQFGPDGLLYFGTGDAARNPLDPLPDPHPRVADPDNRAQDETLLFGKLLRFDVAESAPQPEIMAVGLRNPWRFSFDRETADLYIGDVGQHRWEEIHVLSQPLEPPLNLGWSVCEGVDQYKDEPITGPGTVVGPALVYQHAGFGYCSGIGTVIGGYVYRGTALPDLTGWYVFGDYCSGAIWTMLRQDGAVQQVTKVQATFSRLVSFAEGADGELYAISQTAGVSRIVANAGD